MHSTYYAYYAVLYRTTVCILCTEYILKKDRRKCARKNGGQTAPPSPLTLFDKKTPKTKHPPPPAGKMRIF